jgi:hypothetical protein
LQGDAAQNAPEISAPPPFTWASPAEEGLVAEEGRFSEAADEEEVVSVLSSAAAAATAAAAEP